MKVLFIPGNSPYPIFSHAPLATAARNAGHQVLMGGINWVLPNIASVGLPPVEITPLTVEEVSAFMGAMPDDPMEWAKTVGRAYAEIGVNSLERLLELAEHWRPDIVVGGECSTPPPPGPSPRHPLGTPGVGPDRHPHVRPGSR